jgi:hypothetical protein
MVSVQRLIENRTGNFKTILGRLKSEAQHRWFRSMKDRALALHDGIHALLERLVFARDG